jgi:hypothetical protein
MKQSLEQRKENLLRAIGSAAGPMWISELSRASEHSSVRTALRALINERKVEQIGAKGRRTYYRIATS